ncbi:MAG: S-methyl-5-thioribose-1-phosphate isomerase [Bacteroidota bacterium]|jgi:methylthioribose-1-phosphate isomerase
MRVGEKTYRTIWEKDDVVQIIDQRHLPHKFVIETLSTLNEVAVAIKEMHVRGAPLIGVTAAYGLYLAAVEAKGKADFDNYMQKASETLIATRPTAINLKWAVERVLNSVSEELNVDLKIKTALETARTIAGEDVNMCLNIGEYGCKLIEEISKNKNRETVNILTHCNAGWLAAVDYGTATAPIYLAHSKGIKLHVWVDMTGPRNQGARLTAWELGNEGVPHTVIADNTGGHLMQHGLVDMVIVGSDRTAINGDVANKIGTYLKALAAKDNNIPFYVALPSSTIDWDITDGIKEIPVEMRPPDEVRYTEGLCEGEIKRVLVPPQDSPAVNFAFDVTPARLVTALITERGICKADKTSILELFPGLGK